MDHYEMYKNCFSYCYVCEKTDTECVGVHINKHHKLDNNTIEGFTSHIKTSASRIAMVDFDELHQRKVISHQRRIPHNLIDLFTFYGSRIKESTCFANSDSCLTQERGNWGKQSDDKVPGYCSVCESVENDLKTHLNEAHIWDVDFDAIKQNQRDLYNVALSGIAEIDFDQLIEIGVISKNKDLINNLIDIHNHFKIKFKVGSKFISKSKDNHTFVWEAPTNGHAKVVNNIMLKQDTLFNKKFQEQLAKPAQLEPSGSDQPPHLDSLPLLDEDCPVPTQEIHYKHTDPVRRKVDELGLYKRVSTRDPYCFEAVKKFLKHRFNRKTPATQLHEARRVAFFMSTTPEETEPQLLNVNTFGDVDRLKLMMETYKKTGMKESGLKNILQRYLVLIEVIVDKHNMEVRHSELHAHHMHAQRKA